MGLGAGKEEDPHLMVNAFFRFIRVHVYLFIVKRRKNTNKKTKQKTNKIKRGSEAMDERK